MGELKIGDTVARKSYGGDVYFKIVDIKDVEGEKVITLQGISYRIEADAPETDLYVLTDKNLIEHNSRMASMINKKCRDIQQIHQYRGGLKKAVYRNTTPDNTRKFSRPGKILHIDGDEDYLDTCLKQYRKFGLECTGIYIPENRQAEQIYDLLREHRPDILVLTGHDGVIKGNGNYCNIENYRNSMCFIEGVREARRYEPDIDSLVIFAGACQSMYNLIIKAGANYASSPYRVLIHALDPVFICQKVAFTGIGKTLGPSDVIKNTITGSEGIGGLETRGKYRVGFPVEPYNN
ncbi:spore coat assembly protein [Anaerobacterium chartisolvens]|uniref:Spore coat assembly protein n=1 Tax=Anaerobacterium chartisolvens TaxID=1297424 RepID=A0A369B6B1_9FIRM|nr:spore coat assembly protein [Anaerobacterium chartisolvens]